MTSPTAYTSFSFQTLLLCECAIIERPKVKLTQNSHSRPLNNALSWVNTPLALISRIKGETLAKRWSQERVRTQSSRSPSGTPTSPAGSFGHTLESVTVRSRNSAWHSGATTPVGFHQTASRVTVLQINTARNYVLPLFSFQGKDGLYRGSCNYTKTTRALTQGALFVVFWCNTKHVWDKV